MYKFFAKYVLTFCMLTYAFSYIPLSMAGKDNIGMSTASVSNLRRGASGVISKPDFIVQNNSMKRAGTQTNIKKYNQQSVETIPVNFQYGKQRNRIIRLAFDNFCDLCKESLSCF